MKTLVPGLGNLLLCHEDVGVYAARALIDEGFGAMGSDAGITGAKRN